MPTFALVDCNNFYVSCERLFRPDLRKKPVAVLSNNDGCVVARSQEVKNLGIKMGTPVFQIRHLIQQHGIVTFSSNYELYGDISNRVMSVLEEFSPHVEIYSIDEAFLDLSGMQDLEQYGYKIKDTVLRYLRMPVCVGIGPSKTLAKAANWGAKHYPAVKSVVDLSDPQRQKRLLALMPVDEVWGVGRRHAKRLHNMRIVTALHLAQATPKVIRQKFSVVLERTVMELNGISCLPLEEFPPAQKQMVCSRSFSERITEFDPMREAVCEFTAKAATKLRARKQKASTLCVFIRTSPFDKHHPYFSNSSQGSFYEATSDTLKMVALAGKLLENIWKEDQRYAKAGVMLSDLCQEDEVQHCLLYDAKDSQKSQNLMQAMDRINQSGMGNVYLGSQRQEKEWFMKRELLSPRYTTRWEDIPVVGV